MLVCTSVRDAFRRTPLLTAKVTLLVADSTVITDSMAQIWFAIHVTPPLEMRKVREIGLSEVTVTATRVKMYYKGDTLVYKADAFQLPDGSMLDALIRRLPGVTMNKDGKIFVNGRKVEELLLRSRSFFRGNNKVLLENLPYYAVKDVKVYEQQSDRSRALGFDIDPKKFVMDVSLKSEYNRGLIANAEAAGSTEERWLSRAFLLGFADKLRLTLLGNANNVNETRHIGERTHWTPAHLPDRIITTRNVAADINYHGSGDWLKETFNVGFSSASESQTMHQIREQFLSGSRPTLLFGGGQPLRQQKVDHRNFSYATRDGSFHSAFDQ